MSFCPSVFISTSHLFVVVFFLTDLISSLVWSKSEDHKIIQAGRDFQRSLVQSLAQSRDSSEVRPGCSRFIQSHLENLQEQRLFNHSGQHVPVPDHPQDVKAFSFFPF